MKLDRRVALITGAARRVGRAIALRLAAAGCKTAIHYHRSDADAAETVRLCRAEGVEAETFSADLADAAAIDPLVEAVCARFGRLDFLINNASTFEKMSLDTFDLAAWDETLRVNLTAPMLLARAAAPQLRRNRGRIINLCDISTARPWPDRLAYMASKGGLETLTLALAKALAPDVNVVGIAPGVAAWPDGYDAATRDRLTRRIPLGRPGTPEDIAALAHFLLAEGDYITGTIIPVDGGRGIG
ncbi:MAG: beta-ketoacyl-ACP reductase [Planctomycetota bacterium]